MNDILEQRLAAKKRDLENQQEYFTIDIKNIEQSNYEDNAINALLYMKKLKTEIAELDLDNGIIVKLNFAPRGCSTLSERIGRCFQSAS